MNCLGFVKKIFPSVRNKKTSSLSSPQRQIRKKAEEQHRKDRDSSEDGDGSEVNSAVRESVREKRKLKQQERQANSEEGFKEPQSLNESLEVTLTLTLKKTSLELEEVNEALETLRRHGCVVAEETRRKSIESSVVSVGGSSGYLGGSSSGLTSSSGRSRLSLAPDTEIESHRVRAPLPHPPRVTTVEFAPDNAVAQIESQVEEKKEELDEARLERSSESDLPSRNKTTPAKRGRKRKTEKKELEKKNARSGEGPEQASTEPDTSRTGPPPDEKYCVDSKVFAR